MSLTYDGIDGPVLLPCGDPGRFAAFLPALVRDLAGT